MKLLINDTADVIMKRKSDGHVFVTGEAQLASIASSLGINEKIFGGIGNKALAVMKGQKEVTATIRNAFYDAEFVALTQGVEVQNGKLNVYFDEKDLVVGTGLKVTIVGTPVGTEVNVRNKNGKMAKTTVTGQSVTLPTDFAVEGDKVQVTYLKEVTGEYIVLDSEKFAEAFEVTYHTIGYDPETNKVVKDIYIQLDHAIPNDSLELSLENGNAFAPEVTFECLNPANSTEIGRIIEVARA